VNVLPDLSEKAVDAVAEQVSHDRSPGDLVIVSIHWGPNWGYEIPAAQRRFAHGVIDLAGISIVHGHSSHHPEAIEVYNGRLILYGCGDFLNDYEGITGYEEFRGDLTLMYFAALDPEGGNVVALELVPLRLKRFQLTAAAEDEIAHLQRVLTGDSHGFGARLDRLGCDRLALSWINS